MKKELTKWELAIRKSYKKFEVINPEKARTELGFALQLFQNNEQLQKCDPQSIINAVVNVARTSITLNPVMRLAYLVPRKNKCVLDFSYMGMVAMLKDNGCISTIDAHIVYEDEEFNYNMNTITHNPKFAKTEKEHNLREILGCYSRAVLPNGNIVFEFMPMWEIDKVKKSSTNSSSKYSAWTTWRDEMIKKTVIKRHFKMLISLSNIHNEKLSAFMQIENENNPLKNNFQSKATLSNAFLDNESVTDQEISTVVINNNEKLDSILEDTSTDLKSEAEEVMQITDEDVKKYKNESEQKQMEFLEQQRNFKDSLGDKTKKKK